MMAVAPDCYLGGNSIVTCMSSLIVVAPIVCWCLCLLEIQYFFSGNMYMVCNFCLLESLYFRTVLIDGDQKMKCRNLNWLGVRRISLEYPLFRCHKVRVLPATHLSQMNLPTHISRMSTFPILGMLGGIVQFLTEHSVSK